VPIYGDIRELTADRLAADGITVDAICGGFPCQDISHAGKGAGIEGERSGLWFEYARLIGELRPRYVFVENVSALLNRGIDRVLGDLAALGYDAEWHCIPASAVGAPHRRDRIWIVAYPGHGSGRSIGATEEGRERQAQRTANSSEAGRSSDQSKAVENTQRRGREGLLHGNSRSDHAGAPSHVGDTDSAQRERGSLSSRIYEEHALARSIGWWEIEPDVGRVAHGVPAWSHRLKALGNAVVPQIPELLGRAVLEWEDDQ
jgi:DNA (cytosine-5)-methyltransferase 1